jgi:DNA-binding transcriptional LysR family regulator
MMTNLNELQVFVQVAETGSFTVAAHRLGVPKSTVSRGVTRLEKRLGLRLMERSTRRILLTEAGEVYLKHCRQALEVVEQGESVIDTMRGTPKGRLRIGAPLLFSRLYLTPLVPEFLTLYPELQLHVTLGENNSSLIGTTLDLQIQTGPIEDSEMFVRHLGQVRYGLYASPEYLQRRKAPETPEDLMEHHCLTFRESGYYATWKMSREGERVEIRPLARFSALDSAILSQVALAGTGITVIPEVLATAHVANGHLVPLLTDWELDTVDVSAVYPSPLDLSPKARAFLQFLAERLTLEEPVSSVLNPDQ